MIDKKSERLFLLNSHNDPFVVLSVCQSVVFRDVFDQIGATFSFAYSVALCVFLLLFASRARIAAVTSLIGRAVGTIEAEGRVFLSYFFFLFLFYKNVDAIFCCNSNYTIVRKSVGPSASLSIRLSVPSSFFSLLECLCQCVLVY